MTSNQPLVSIVTPCFNGGAFIHRFFESVLKQTYPNLELFFVNDGSTDNTEEIALSFREKLEKKGIRYIYCRLPQNEGQAFAINSVLGLIRGEYLTWPDSDDWLADNCIEKKVLELEKHPEWGLVCCRSAVVDEDNTDEIMYYLERKSKNSENLFRDLIIENDAYFVSGAYLVRTRALLSELEDGQIYAGRGGQNWQLLLPVTHKYACGFIDEVLYYVVARNESHSRAVKSYSSLIAQTYQHEEILLETIKRLKADEREKRELSELVEEKYTGKRYRLSLKAKDAADLRKNYKKMKEKKLADFSVKLSYWKQNGIAVYYLLRLAHLPVGLLNRITKRTD